MLKKVITLKSDNKSSSREWTIASPHNQSKQPEKYQNSANEKPPIHLAPKKSTTGTIIAFQKISSKISHKTTQKAPKQSAYGQEQTFSVQKKH